MIRSYGKVYHFGHRAVDGMLNKGNVVVQEKIDGSQISFGLFGGQFKMRSRGKAIDIDNPDSMFAKAVEQIGDIKNQLRDGWVYRGEYLKTRKHNTLCYDRIPARHVILFDIDVGEDHMLSPDEFADEAARLGLESVPVLWAGAATFLTFEKVQSLLETDSILGGQKVEGVVVKNYDIMDADGRPCKAKHVSEAFKEIHQGDWRERNPSRNDVVERLIEKYKSPARWEKAVQHLRDEGELENSPRDIGKLMKELHTDLQEEAVDDIKEVLFKWAWKKIASGSSRGFAEWYKEKLMKEALDG